MKLLLDANLSHRVLTAIGSDFPESSHVRNVGLARASDVDIWRFARDNAFAIVTLDADFYDLSLLRGSPPQILWVRTHDTTTQALIEIFRQQRQTIQEFLGDPGTACLVLRRRR